jgi:catechol 2,3-dioxygenase-like lactoylglutathione lyase family enzyme
MAGLVMDHVQIAMPAGGEAAARRFFGGLLGLAEIAKPADLAARGGCWFALGTLQLHLGVDPDFRAAGKAHVALRADDLPALRNRLASAGHVLTDDCPVAGHARFFTADPFGNRIEFIAA